MSENLKSMDKMRSTIYDVARRAKVSTATVSRVFSQQAPVSEKTRRRVMEATQQLQFSANRIAAGLRRGRSDAISLVMPFNTPELMDAAQQSANAHQYTLMVQFTFQPDVEAELRALKMALEHQVAGLIWQPTGRPEDYASILPSLNQSRTVVLLLENGAEIMPEADLIYHDTEHAVITGIEHLKAEGYHTLFYLYKGDSYVLRQHRREQFDTFAGDHSRVLACSPDDVATLLPAALEKAGAGPIGLFVDDDWTAMAAAQAVEAMGLRIPQDVGLILLGDMLIGNRFRVGEITRPTLSAMQRQQQKMACTCVEWLLERINDREEVSSSPRRLAIPLQLIVRESTRRDAQPTHADSGPDFPKGKNNSGKIAQ